MSPHLEEIARIYESNEIDFHRVLDWHLCFGIVVSDPDVLAFCFFSRHESPTVACKIHEADTLFVTMFCGDMEKALASYQDRFGFIAFQREFNNSPRVRIYDMQKFYSKLK